MSWFYLKDVMEDLEQAMGGRVKGLDEQWVVTGEQPPPICSAKEDEDEYLLRLKGGVKDNIHNEDRTGPDLAGITQMLRMVDKFQNSDNENPRPQDCNTTTISITKLNPNASKFISNNFRNNNNTDKEKTDIMLRANENCLKIGEASSDFKETACPVDITEISEKLKRKISSPSKKTCLKMKTERNLAIATLLKLYSNEPMNTAVDKNQPTLLTPEHFEKPGTNMLKIHSASQSSSSKSSCRAINIKEDINVKQEVEESVAKVDSWLNKNEKPKERGPLYLGQVTFKKKEKVKPITPTSDASDKTSGTSTAFVPSEFASKLTESYMVRSKARDNRTLDMWTKLEKEMKEKDESIKQRILESASSSKEQNQRRH